MPLAFGPARGGGGQAGARVPPTAAGADPPAAAGSSSSSEMTPPWTIYGGRVPDPLRYMGRYSRGLTDFYCTDGLPSEHLCLHHTTSKHKGNPRAGENPAINHYCTSVRYASHPTPPAARSWTQLPKSAVRTRLTSLPTYEQRPQQSIGQSHGHSEVKGVWNANITPLLTSGDKGMARVSGNAAA